MNAPLQDHLSRLDAKELTKLYKNCFETEAGRLVMEDLRNRCFIYAPANSEVDEGMRRVVLTMESIIEGRNQGAI